MIKPTYHGVGFIASTIVLALLALALKDIYIALATLALTSILLYEILEARRLDAIECRVEPSIVRNRIWIWEKDRVELRVYCPSLEDIKDLPMWLKIVSIEGGGVEHKVILETNFRYHGNYRIESLGFLRRARLGLFKVFTKAKLLIEYRVLPETLYWIIVALGLLGLRGAGIECLGTVTGGRKSISGEYYETREYMPGDPLKRIDWKATARRLKLMVKEFREEVSGGIALVCDFRCLGKYTCDRIASAILSTAIAAYKNQVPITVLEVPELRGYRFLNPRDALTLLLLKILDMKVVEETDVYEYTRPLTISEIRRLLSGMVRRRVKVRAIPAGVNETIYVSVIVDDVRTLLDTIDMVRSTGRVTVITSPRPWIDVKDPEQAYRVYLTYTNILEKLREMNIGVIEWRR